MHKELLILCMGEVSLEVVQEWLKTHEGNHDLLRNATDHRDDSNRTPLHWLVSSQPPSDLVEKFLQLAPHTVSVSSIDGHLPLHNACLNYASPDVMRMLLEAYPEAVEIQDRDGWLPLHIACARGASLDVVKMLLGPYPEAAQIQNTYGDLPIHYACHSCCINAPDVVRMLLEKFPKAVEVKNKDGFLPLHAACKLNDPYVIKILLEAYPEAVEIQDHDGHLPLHLACINKASPDVMKMLLNQDLGVGKTVESHVEAILTDVKTKVVKLELQNNKTANELRAELVKMKSDITDMIELQVEIKEDMAQLLETMNDIKARMIGWRSVTKYQKIEE
jgi:ankyrin repeat protein